MPSKCPTCRKEFKNEHGVKVHHSRAHGESLAREVVECAWCGEEFEVTTYAANKHGWHTCSDKCDSKYRPATYTQENNPNAGNWHTIDCEHCGEGYRVPEHRLESSRFCSLECKYNWESDNLSGEQAHAWNGGTATLTCENCGEKYEVFQSLAENSRYCSYECMGEFRSKEMKGKNNPSWKGGNVTLECEYCGEKYETFPAKREISRFCSYQCLDYWRSENMAGQDSPHWRGGYKTRVAVKKQLPGPSWRRIRRSRIGNSCEICESTSDLCLHHIVPIMDGGTNEEWNLMTLCRTCHTRTEHYTRTFSELVLVDE